MGSAVHARCIGHASMYRGCESCGDAWMSAGCIDHQPQRLIHVRARDVLLSAVTHTQVIKIDEKIRPPHLNEQENRYGEQK